MSKLSAMVAVSIAIAAWPQFAQAQYPAQYPGSKCDSWERQCTRLYGPETNRWYACMHQPRAMYDCQDDAGYMGIPPHATPMCNNWRTQCAKFYGAHTRKYRACMHQPQAIVDCGSQ